MWDYGDDGRGTELAAISIAMAAVSVLAVALRSYTMSTILKRFVIEDWLAVLTCLLQVGFCVVVVVGVSYGLGAHIDHVPEVNRPKALIYKWAGQVAYIVVSTLVKFVVGIFLLRLCVNNNWQRLTIIILLIIVGLFNTFYVFLAIFQCQPVEFYWYRYETDSPVTGRCNGHALATIPTYFAVFIGIVADLILALLPATLIKGANLDKKTKISVCCVLALGSLASVATIARIPYAKQLLSNPDYLYNFTDLAIWSIVECGIAITASSLATLRPLFIKMRLLATSHFTQRYGHSRYGSAGLPIQSANTITVITSRSRSTKRHTAMTGSTGFTASTAVTGATSGLASVKESKEGIYVEKEFEMSVITKQDSQDSIDQLEAEVNEVISPGSGRRKLSYASSNHNRSRPAPLQTSFQSSASASPSTPVNVSAGSSQSGHRFMGQAMSSNPPSPQPPRPTLDGRTRSSSYDRYHSGMNSRHAEGTPPRSPPPMPGHHHTYSEGTLRSAAFASAAPSFHLPMRAPHQSIASNHSDSSMHDFRGTPIDEAGLSAPPRMFGTTHTDYPPTNAPNPLGSPVSLSGRLNGSISGSPVMQPHGSPAPTSWSPFQTQGAMQDVSGSRHVRPGKQRVSAFLADADESSHSSAEGLERHIEEDGEHEAQTITWTPRRHEMPSPLRSHPPSSPHGGWV